MHRGDNANPERLRDLATTAEQAGFESLWVGDHIALSRDAPDYWDESRFEALTTLAFAAAVTTRIRLGVAVIVLPQRQPVLLAKQLTTIDRLSNGRLTVGIGAGYLKPELEALGVALSDRGAKTDEFIEVLFGMWKQEQSYSGRWVNYDGVLQAPQPVQQPHPPLVVGGHARVALERAARVGDGWFGWKLSAAAVAESVQTLQGLRAQSGAAPLEITIVADEPMTPKLAREYEAAGVHRLVLVPPVMSLAETDALVSYAAAELLPDAER
jgi:probable F420-dependent oxidoreductase